MSSTASSKVDSLVQWLNENAYWRNDLIIKQSKFGGLGVFYPDNDDQEEDENDPAIVPLLPTEKRLKLATLKVADIGQGNKYGEGLLKISFDIARQSRVNYMYVTVFAKQESLIYLLKQVGFEQYGLKQTQNGEEEVYIRRFIDQYNYDQPIKAYPYIPRNRQNQFALYLSRRNITVCFFRLQICKEPSTKSMIIFLHLMLFGKCI